MRITAKLGNMRKAVEWTVYPFNPDSKQIIVQSDTRIAQFDPKTGIGRLSKNHSSGAYFIHLALAPPVQVPQTFIDQCLANQPQKGDYVGGGVYIG